MEVCINNQNQDLREANNSFNINTVAIKESNSMTSLNNSSNKMGKVRIISEKRVRGDSYCVLILSYLLIIIPSLAFTIFV